ncbi:sigma 54-interacting transcriptional regulator [Sorangium sp. wiwo2]|uniref:Sigma 54-interacting transcriptional regulator n=1 Tax=Sorangium atrum TaxID=2995308 RepID=A0ABT5BQ13_9BACT|nr:sigma 54-interacting transcriptional regulator [Sorangium aterium]
MTHTGSPADDGAGAVRRFRLELVEGPARGVVWDSSADRCSLGSDEGNDLVVADPTVSRFHCEIRIDEAGARVRDLKSRNGTAVDGVSVVEAFLRTGSLIRVGKTVARFEFGTEHNRLPLWDEARFGALSGASAAMRGVFALLARAAERDVTVLLEGETGTGKSQAARSIHERGARREKPFVVVDCGAIHGNLIESELFGHAKGAFTGAAEQRVGAFEEASGGTIFLDEIGELPLDLQPKLLRALEAREIRRVGTNTARTVDVRVIAATHRDLRSEVNAGRFRADLYFRIAVVRIPMPPLRQRPEDIPALLDDLLAALHATPEEAAALREPKVITRLKRAAWPGNVRELRNYVEQYLVFRAPPPVSELAPVNAPPPVDASVPYAEARDRVLADFERRYFEALLRAHDGKVSRAAAAAGLDRRYLYRLLHRHGLGPERDPEG